MPASRQPGGQALDVAPDRRHHAGVQHRCQAALVFPHHGQHVHRGGHGHAGQFFPQDRGDTAFVGREGEGVQQADSHRLDIQPPHRLGGISHAGFVERDQDVAGGADALDHLQDAFRRDRAARLHPGKQVGARAGCPAARSP